MLKTLKELDQALDLLIPYETAHTARQNRANSARHSHDNTALRSCSNTEQQNCSDTQQLKELLNLLHANEARLSPYLDTEAVSRNLRRALAV